MLSRIKALMCILSLVSTNLIAECQKPVQMLKNGDLAPCDGYLFSPDKELEVRISSEENKILKKQLPLLNNQIYTLKQQLELDSKIIERESQKSELWRVKAYEMTEKFIESENNRGKRDLFFLIGGVILTIGAGFAVGQANK